MPKMQPQAETTAKVRDRNKQVVQQIVDAFNTGVTASVDEVTHPKLLDHTPIPAAGKGGRVGITQQISAIHKAFKGVKFEVETMVAEGDMVFLRWKMTATHTAQMFSGDEASNKPVTRFGHEILRIDNGLIVEHQHYFDRASAQTLGKSNADA